jgi:hypothetical protein
MQADPKKRCFFWVLFICFFQPLGGHADPVSAFEMQESHRKRSLEQKVHSVFDWPIDLQLRVSLCSAVLRGHVLAVFEGRGSQLLFQGCILFCRQQVFGA